VFGRGDPGFKILRKNMKIKNLLYAGVLLLLTSCSHWHQDGPPSYYVDASKVPDAVPKPEPLSKFGNMPSYYVFGKKYYVMKSSKNYQQQGIASWYGTKFHQHRTSSGERYDMLGMTAAHKTLPLPTYVQVTNLANGKKIIVKVNDRGPFESNRLIDLSYVAAKKLGMLGHGTTRVDVKAIDPLYYNSPNQMHWLASNNVKHFTPSPTVTRNSHSFTAKPALAEEKLYLQVGVFRNRLNAEKLRKRLLSVVTPPVYITQRNSESNLYRVRIGPIKDVAAANLISKKLKTMGLSSAQLIS
jgi:rare lipoprotein A